MQHKIILLCLALANGLAAAEIAGSATRPPISKPGDLLDQTEKAMADATTQNIAAEVHWKGLDRVTGASFEKSWQKKALAGSKKYMIDYTGPYCHFGGPGQGQSEFRSNVPTHIVGDGNTVWIEYTVDGRKDIYKSVPRETGTNANFAALFHPRIDDTETATALNVEKYRTGADFTELKETRLDGKAVYVINGSIKRDYVNQLFESAKGCAAESDPMERKMAPMLKSYAEAMAGAVCSLYVGKEDCLLRKFEIKNTQGGCLLAITYNLKTDVKFDDALFAYAPPAGAKVQESK